MRIAAAVTRFSAALVALALVLAACGTPAPSPADLQTLGPTPAGPPQDSPAPSTGPTPPASFPPSPGAGDVVPDASLLAILPPDLDGAPVTAEDQAFAEAANDPAFRRNVARAVFPIVVAGDDLASGVVAQLIPDRFSDAFFRSWRDTYNDGACGQAGGVTGNAEAELGGRKVYIATCAGGLRVYHAWLEERNVLVSMFSLGKGRFGERLMSDLRP